MNGADACTGQHRYRQLGDQRQIQRHAIALLDAERFQDVGELRDLAVQVVVGQRATVARLALPDDRRLVSARAADVTVDAIDAGVDRPADEPFRMRRLPVEHPIPAFCPFELARKPRPEGFGIALGFCVNRVVGNMGAGAKRRSGREGSIFSKKIAEFGGVLVSHAADSNGSRIAYVGRPFQGRRTRGPKRPALHLRSRRALLEDGGAEKAAESRENRSDSQNEKQADDAGDRSTHHPPRSRAVFQKLPDCGRHIAGHLERALKHRALDRLEQDADRNGQHEIDERANDSREEPDQRTVAGRDWQRLILLEHVRGDESAADHPQTATDIDGVDQGERRQYSHDESADQRRLAVASLGGPVSRNIRVQDG